MGRKVYDGGYDKGLNSSADISGQRLLRDLLDNVNDDGSERAADHSAERFPRSYGRITRNGNVRHHSPPRYLYRRLCHVSRMLGRALSSLDFRLQQYPDSVIDVLSPRVGSGSGVQENKLEAL